MLYYVKHIETGWFVYLDCHDSNILYVDPELMFDDLETGQVRLLCVSSQEHLEEVWSRRLCEEYFFGPDDISLDRTLASLCQFYLVPKP